MKKKLLPLAMLAGLAGAAGTAQAVYINGDGLGETLIYPFYTVENGQNTYVNITNTTDYYKAVKVRFLEGENSAEVLDFNLYLSPHDVWTGAVVPTSDGAKIITRDNSCTVPYIQRPNAEGVGTDGVNFRDFEYEGDGGTQSLDRTREGYIEIIEMGVIIDADMQADIIHTPDGKPEGCDDIRGNWLGNGVSSGNSPLFEETTVGSGTWLGDAAEGFAEQENLDGTSGTQVELGGLYGYGVIINPAEGSGSAYNAVALDQFFGAAVAIDTYDPQHTDPGSVLPSLGSAAAIAQIIDGNQIIDADFDNGWDAVSAVFMHDTLSNDFVLDVAVNADTDWIITMPTKREYVNQGLDGDDEPNDALPPFTQSWDEGSCEVIGIEAWDREEAVTELTGDIDFSPRPNPEDGPDPSSICSEVNILMFGDGTAVHASDRIAYGMPELGFENGWVRLTFADDDTSERVLEGVTVDAEDVSLYGLPVTGFAVQKFINGNMEGGTLANYAWLVQHSYTRLIVVSD